MLNLFSSQQIHLTWDKKKLIYFRDSPASKKKPNVVINLYMYCVCLFFPKKWSHVVRKLTLSYHIARLHLMASMNKW